MLLTQHDNQTKRVCKLACKRTSADCSASVLRKAKQSAKHHLAEVRLARSIFACGDRYVLTDSICASRSIGC